MSTEQIKSLYSDRYAYFKLCCDVSNASGTDKQAVACLCLRKVMLALGYTSETATWNDERTMMYAQNIVMMG